MAQDEDNVVAGSAGLAVHPEQDRLSLSLFRRPEKYRIGEDFNFKKFRLMF